MNVNSFYSYTCPKRALLLLFRPKIVNKTHCRPHTNAFLDILFADKCTVFVDQYPLADRYVNNCIIYRLEEYEYNNYFLFKLNFKQILNNLEVHTCRTFSVKLRNSR